MAVRTKEDLLEMIKSRVGDDTSDEAISLIEDVNDTFDDYDRRITESGDWETKYKENDEAWRTRYKERFFSGEGSEPADVTKETETETEKHLSYEDLFEEKED